MITLVPEPIEKYAARHTVPETPLFKELAKETYESTDCPQMQVGQLEGAFLRLLVRLSGAQKVLEIGTFTGYSSLAMAEGLPEGGTLWTCDIDPHATEIAKRYWSRNPQGKKIRLCLGPAMESLSNLPGPFDFVFIDADKENYVNYWNACVPKVRPGGMIVVDNVLWSGRVLEPKSESDKAIVAFNTRAAADERVETVMLSVRDGILLARKL